MKKVLVLSLTAVFLMLNVFSTGYSAQEARDQKAIIKESLQKLQERLSTSEGSDILKRYPDEEKMYSLFDKILGSSSRESLQSEKTTVDGETREDLLKEKKDYIKRSGKYLKAMTLR